jgi:uncharacterized repeat protein (TIGR02543 family)
MRFLTCRKFLFALLVLFSFILISGPALGAQLKFAWDPNTEPDLAGYKLYYGTTSESYGSPINAGNVTTYTLSGLTSGQRYYISVTAYDTSSNESGYSSEVNGIATDPTLTQTVATSPSGLQITVDGTTYTSPRTFNWAAGSSHTLSVSSPQSGLTGIRYIYGSWSDGGGQSHTITAPSSSITYTASFITQYTLTSSAAPVAGGTVSPSGTSWQNSGQTIPISAGANTGYSFSNWSGDLSGTSSSASLVMTAPKTVTANFTQNQYTLTINILPTGSGSVTKNPNKTSYTHGETVTLTAAANSEYTFNNWSGDGTGSTNPITVSMTGPKTVTANFNANPGVLSVTPGTGLSASGNKGGPFAPSSQTYTLQNTGGASVNWTASKAQTWVSLSPGSGSLARGASATVTVSINSNASGLNGGSYSDIVNFVNATNGSGNTSRSVALSVNAVPQSYTVTTDPLGLQVVVDGVTHTSPKDFGWVANSLHTLSAPSPQSGASDVRYLFKLWSDRRTQTHTVVAPASGANYIANFKRQHNLKVSANPSNGGTVTPSGTWYDSGAALTLTARAVFGYRFNGWSGDLSGMTNPVSVTMDGPKNVAANFAPIPEEISPPITPKGVLRGDTGTSYRFSTGRSASNLRHPVEYQFDWKGDEATGLSSWGAATQFKIWTLAGNYQVKGRARCVDHPNIVSEWSEAIPVSVAEKPFVHLTSPNGGEAYRVGTTHTISWESGYLNSTGGRIYLFYRYGNAWHPIGDVSATEKSCSWTIPEVPEKVTFPVPATRTRSISLWIGNWVNGSWECRDESDSRFVIFYDEWVFTLFRGDSGGASIAFGDADFDGYGISSELGMFRIGGSYSIDGKGLMSGSYRLNAFDNPSILLGDGNLTGWLDLSALRLNLTMKNSNGTPAFSMNGLRLLEPPAVPQDWTGTLSGAWPGAFDSLKIEPYQVGDEVYSRFFKISGSGVAIDLGPIEMEGYFFLTLSMGSVYGSYELTGDIIERGGLTGTLNPALGKISFRMTSENGRRYTLTGKKVHLRSQLSNGELSIGVVSDN